MRGPYVTPMWAGRALPWGKRGEYAVPYSASEWGRLVGHRNDDIHEMAMHMVSVDSKYGREPGDGWPWRIRQMRVRMEFIEVRPLDRALGRVVALWALAVILRRGN